MTYIIVILESNQMSNCRSLKLWMVLRLYGLQNLQRYLRNHIKLAELFEELVAADFRFEVMNSLFSLLALFFFVSLQ